MSPPVLLMTEQGVRMVRAMAVTLAASCLSTEALMRLSADEDAARDRAKVLAKDLRYVLPGMPESMRMREALVMARRAPLAALKHRAVQETVEHYACGCGHTWSRRTRKLLVGATEVCPSCRALCAPAAT